MEALRFAVATVLTQITAPTRKQVIRTSCDRITKTPKSIIDKGASDIKPVAPPGLEPEFKV